MKRHVPLPIPKNHQLPGNPVPARPPNNSGPATIVQQIPDIISLMGLKKKKKTKNCSPNRFLNPAEFMCHKARINNCSSMAISPITCDPKTTLNTPETTRICAPFSARNSMCSDPPAGGGCLLLTPEQKSPGLQGQAGSSLSHSPRAVAPVHTQR